MMNKSRPFLLLAIAAACITAAITNPAIRGGSKVYEIRPQISIPEYQLYPLNTAVIFQQMLEQQKAIMDEGLAAVGSDLKTIADKLDLIDTRLTKLSDRLARIEDVLGLKSPQKVASDNNVAIQSACGGIDQNQIKPVLPADKK